MTVIEKRIKEVRQTLQLTQTAFGKRNRRFEGYYRKYRK